MQEKANQHIPFLDGLRGYLAVIIVIYHYTLAFFPYGYIGWGSGCDPAGRCQRYFQNYPLSLFFQLQCLPLFYAMIAYIPALKIFRDGKTAFIEKQALGRYFRLMPVVLATVLFSYAVYAFGWSQHLKIADLLGNEWLRAANYYSAKSWLDAIKNGVWDTFALQGAGGYCSVLWCINEIFVGSYLTYAFLLMFRNVQHRLPVYVACYLLLLKYPAFCGFLSGIASADVFVHAQAEQLKKPAVPCLVLAFILACLPEPLMPAWFPVGYREGLASLLLLCAVPFLPALNQHLSGKVINWLGKRSFPLILTHFPIMLSVSALVFAKLYAAQVPQFLCLLAAFLAGVPLILAAAEIMYRYVEMPTGRLTKYLVEKLSGCGTKAA